MSSCRSWRLFALLVSLFIFGCRTGPAHVSDPTKSQVRAWLAAGNYRALDKTFSAIQAEYREGKRSDEALYTAFSALYDADSGLDPAYDSWVKAFPRSYVALLSRGIHHRKVGQARRGGAFISETSRAQIQSMELEYAYALQDLEASGRLDSRPLLTMSNELDIVVNDEDTNRMQAILAESIKIDPANFVVRRLYLTYLAPRWGGSEQQMQDFIEEARTDGLAENKVRRLEAVVYQDRALTAENAGDDVTAEAQYRQALAMGDDGCTRCFAMVLVREKKFADAIPVLTRALQADPADRELLYWRATSYLGTGSSQAGFADMLESAKLGYSYAQNMVAIDYMNGVPGVIPPNADEGIKWLRACAPSGNADCTRNLQIVLGRLPRHQ